MIPTIARNITSRPGKRYFANPNPASDETTTLLTAAIAETIALFRRKRMNGSRLKTSA